MLSLIFGILAFVCIAVGYFVTSLNFLIFIGFVLGLVAWITGAKAVKRSKSNGKARAGKILGIIATVIGIVVIVLVFALAGLFYSVAVGM